jgi:hypothetical protein
VRLESFYTPTSRNNHHSKEMFALTSEGLRAKKAKPNFRKRDLNQPGKDHGAFIFSLLHQSASARCFSKPSDSIRVEALRDPSIQAKATRRLDIERHEFARALGRASWVRANWPLPDSAAATVRVPRPHEWPDLFVSGSHGDRGNEEKKRAELWLVARDDRP